MIVNARVAALGMGFLLGTGLMAEACAQSNPWNAPISVGPTYGTVKSTDNFGYSGAGRTGGYFGSTSDNSAWSLKGAPAGANDMFGTGGNAAGRGPSVSSPTAAAAAPSGTGTSPSSTSTGFGTMPTAPTNAGISPASPGTAITGYGRSTAGSETGSWYSATGGGFATKSTSAPGIGPGSVPGSATAPGSTSTSAGAPGSTPGFEPAAGPAAGSTRSGTGAAGSTSTASRPGSVWKAISQ